MNDNKKFWSHVAKIYEKFVKLGNGSKAAYDKMEIEIIEQLKPQMKVLELAAGPGLLSDRIAPACGSLIVTDFSEEMVKQIKRRGLPENTFVQVADATNLEFDDSVFDAVIIANALHIMPNPQKALSEIKRVLKSDGILIAPTFTRENIKSKLIEKMMEAIGFRTYSVWTHDTYQNFLKKNQFHIKYTDVITGHNFPISFIVCAKGDD